MLLKVAFVMVLAVLEGATAANILALITIPSPSHHIWNRALVRGLAERGHHVTTVSADREKDRHPNHREVIIEDAYNYHVSEDTIWDFEAMSEDGPLTSLAMMHNWGLQICRQAFTTQGVKTLMQMKNETFDLIVVEAATCECFLGFIPYFGSPPVVAVTAFSSPPWVGSLFSNPDPAAYIPNIWLPYSEKMTFFQRVANTLMYQATHFKRTYEYLPRLDVLVRENLGDSMPSINEIERNLSMILVNTDISIDYPRPLVPTMVPVGGLHLKPAKPLPKDLQKFMDEAPHGVIFFSLGSNLRSDKLGQDKINALVAAFKQLPQRVLWKWESESLPGQPSNVRLGKWLPQSDILAHPNTRLFITHSGLLSFQEAVYHAVPVVGIPFFADQHINMLKAQQYGVGEKVAIKTLSTQSVLTAVKKVLENPSYRENMKKLSKIFHDQPQTPLERAVFWTEYVIRHKGAPHLRSAASNLTWYQNNLLDVIAFLAVGTLAALATMYLVLRILCALILGRKGKKQKRQ